MKIRHIAPLLVTGWRLMVPSDSSVPHSVDPAPADPQPALAWVRNRTCIAYDDPRLTN